MEFASSVILSDWLRWRKRQDLKCFSPLSSLIPSSPPLFSPLLSSVLFPLLSCALETSADLNQCCPPLSYYQRTRGGSIVNELKLCANKWGLDKALCFNIPC